MNDHFPMLTLCIVWPLLGALSLSFISHLRLARYLALSSALIELLLTLLVTVGFNAEDGGFQWQEDHLWLANLNIHYQLGVDGISILFLPATALLMLTALLTCWNTIQLLTRFHLALLLILESVTIGVFTALDTVLFFLFWELTLPPLFFLIGLWGIGAQRRQAAMKYTLFMLFGGVPILFAFIILANPASGAGSELLFSLPRLLQDNLAGDSQRIVFWLLLLGFAVKAPLAGLHTWMPATAIEAPAHVTAVLLGLKLGIYGILRFAIPLAPAAALEYQWLLAVWGAITLIYGALLAMRQTNLRSLLACSSISHVGLVLIGISSFNRYGLQGAVMQLLNFSVVASGLMLLSGMIQQRLGSTESVHLGGLAKPMPRLTALFFLFAFASIGLPLTSSFPAELLILIGAMQAYPVMALAALFGAVLAANYLLGFIRHAFWGPVASHSLGQAQDLRPRELILLLLPALLILMFGSYPSAILKPQQSAIDAWLSRLHPPVLPSTQQVRMNQDQRVAI